MIIVLFAFLLYLLGLWFYQRSMETKERQAKCHHQLARKIQPSHMGQSFPTWYCPECKLQMPWKDRYPE